MKSVIGLDLGIKSIKLVNLALKGKNIELLKLETIDVPKISNQKEAIDLLKAMFRSQKLRLSTPLCLSISAEDSFFKIIPVQAKSNRKLKEAIKAELRKNVVFSLEDCIWDYSLLKYKPQDNVNEVLLVAAKKEAVFNKTQLAKQFNNAAPMINLDILATYNCLKFNTDLLSGKLNALVDISSNKMQVLIFDEKENFWMRTIPFGGDKFTELIAKTLGLSLNEAQEQKNNMFVQGEITAQLKEPSLLVMKQFAAELDKTFNYFYFQASESAAKEPGQKINEIFLSGGGGLYLGLDKFLSETFNMPTRYLYPFNKLSVRDKKLLSKNNILSTHSPQFATAIGLALQGLRASEIKINLVESKNSGALKNFNLTNSYYAAVAACVALLLFLAIQIFSLNKETRALLPQTKELNAATQKYMPRIIDLQTAGEKIGFELKQLNTMVTQRSTISRIIQKLSQIISKDAWVTNFVINLEYPDRSGELTLSGRSKGYPGINELISGFKDTGLFSEIKPVSSKVMVDQVTKEEIVNFVIKLELREI